MADNTVLPGTGEVIASDDVAGVKYQIVKIGHGPDGSAPAHASTANPLPVSMSNTLALTDAQLRAAAVPVSGAFFQATQPTTAVDVTATGALAAAAQTVVLSMAGGKSAATVQITGTWAGTIQFEGTVNGTDWTPINGVYAGTSFPIPTITANGIVRLTPAGLASVRVNMTAFTSGSATIAMRASDGVGGVFANQILPMRAIENALVSTINSSAVALGIGGVFTGAAEDVTEFADVRVVVFADQASAVDGLQMQQSTNGTNWDVADSYSIPAATGKVFSVGVSAKFYRVVYTNGATAQTAFRLQTKLHKTYSKGSSVKPQDARSNDNDFEEVSAFNMVYNGTSWDRLRGDATNGLRTQAAAVTALTTLSVANTAATLTLPAPAAGLFNYVTHIRITLHNTSAAAVVGSAVALAFTSTNLPGALAWTDGNALAAGTSKTVVDEVLPNAIRSSAAATATTITAPIAGAGVQSRITAYFYTGP